MPNRRPSASGAALIEHGASKANIAIVLNVYRNSLGLQRSTVSFNPESPPLAELIPAPLMTTVSTLYFTKMLKTLALKLSHPGRA